MYALQNSSSTTLRIFATVGTLDSFKESLPKATSSALDKAYLATIKCVAVNKAFKKGHSDNSEFSENSEFVLR